MVAYPLQLLHDLELLLDAVIKHEVRNAAFIVHLNDGGDFGASEGIEKGSVSLLVRLLDHLVFIVHGLEHLVAQLRAIS